MSGRFASLRGEDGALGVIALRRAELTHEFDPRATAALDSLVCAGSGLPGALKSFSSLLVPCPGNHAPVNPGTDGVRRSPTPSRLPSHPDDRSVDLCQARHNAAPRTVLPCHDYSIAATVGNGVAVG